jgi:hypothetical protein
VKRARGMAETNHVRRVGRVVERKVGDRPGGDSPAGVRHSADKFLKGQPELLLDRDDVGPGDRNGKGPTATGMTRIAQPHSLTPIIAMAQRQSARLCPIIVTIVAIDSDESVDGHDWCHFAREALPRCPQRFLAVRRSRSESTPASARCKLVRRPVKTGDCGKRG